MSLLDTIVLLIEITPEFIFSKPAIDLKIVVFPLPEGPNNDIISPYLTFLRIFAQYMHFVYFLTQLVQLLRFYVFSYLDVYGFALLYISKRRYFLQKLLSI